MLLKLWTVGLGLLTWQEIYVFEEDYNLKEGNRRLMILDNMDAVDEPSMIKIKYFMVTLTYLVTNPYLPVNLIVLNKFEFFDIIETRIGVTNVKCNYISDQNIAQYLSDPDNSEVLYTVSRDMTYQEFVAFLKIQNQMNNVDDFVSANIDVVRSLIEKIKQVDQSVKYEPYKTEDALSNFEHHYDEAKQITSEKHRSIMDMVHEFEQEHSILISDAPVYLVHDLMRRFDAKSSGMAPKLVVIADYVTQLIQSGISLDNVNHVRTIDVKDIDITDIMKRHCVGSKAELIDIINTCFSPIEENIHTNRLVLTLLLAYDGVEPNEVTSLKESDVADGVLHYQGKEIVLDEMSLKILELWEEGFCMTHTKSKKPVPLLESDLLIKSHQPFTYATLSALMHHTVKRYDVKQLSIRDVYASGTYERYTKTGDYTLSKVYEKNWLSDCYYWQKAFFCL